MVISLDSQNVKVKSSGYAFRKRFLIGEKARKNRINLNIGKHLNYYFKVFLKVNYGIFVYFFSALIFSIIFSTGSFLYIPTNQQNLSTKSIVFPNHSADVFSKNLMVNFAMNSNTSLFREEILYPGETLSSISIKYGLLRGTLLHVNDVHSIDHFLEKNRIIIPEVDGYIHKVGPKDTIDSISKKYNVLVKDIFRVNRLKSENISSIDTIYIPGVDPEKWGWHTDIKKSYIYPVNGYITKRYGPTTNDITGLTTLYEGVDLVPFDSKDVIASLGGRVSGSGYSGNYGHYIYIDHPGEMRTLYAHLSRIDVDLFDSVSQGDTIGKIGKSGFTNIEKLFFTIFYKNETVNPEDYLK